VRTRVALVTLAALLSLTAAACTEDEPGEEQDDTTSAAFRTALDTFPADTELVRFVDRSAVDARLGVDRIESLEAPADARAYARADLAAEWGRTEIAPFAVTMSRRGAFSELDVQWAARGVVTTEAGFDGWSLFRLEEDADLGRIADALKTAGYVESDLAGHRHLTAPATGRDGLVDGVYPAGALHEVTFVPEEHLLVTGTATPVLDVLTGRTKSLLDAGTFDEVSSQVPVVEYAELRAAAAIDCAAPIVGTGTLTAAELTAIQAALGMTGLQKPVTSALYVVGDETPRGVTLLEFADSATAREDADVRAAWLKAGRDVVTRLQNSDLYTVSNLVAAENLETVEWTYAENPAPAVRAHQSGAGAGACTG
jgi:hypothetical protein